MPRNRPNFAPLLRTAALYLSVGLFLTIAISWSLAAWMPQRNWEPCSYQIPGDGTPGATPRLCIDRYDATGCIRRTWRIASQGYVDLCSPIFNDNVPSPPVQVIYEREYLRLLPLDWPQWGNVPSAVNSWFLSSPASQDDAYVWLRSQPDTTCEHATGWPFVALWYEIAFPNYGAKTSFEMRSGIALQQSPALLFNELFKLKGLPYHPIYPGLILNSIFWGAIAFTTTRLALYLRAQRRKRHNLCPTCAYDLQNIPTPGCPECGWNRPTTSTNPTSIPAPQRGAI